MNEPNPIAATIINITAEHARSHGVPFAIGTEESGMHINLGGKIRSRPFTGDLMGDAALAIIDVLDEQDTNAFGFDEGMMDALRGLVANATNEATDGLNRYQERLVNAAAHVMEHVESIQSYLDDVAIPTQTALVVEFRPRDAANDYEKNSETIEEYPFEMEVKWHGEAGHGRIISVLTPKWLCQFERTLRELLISTYAKATEGLKAEQN